jgi:hypothetical protein
MFIHHRTLALIAGALVALLLGAGYCAGRRSQRSVIAAAETRALAASGALTASEATRAELEYSAQELAGELARVRATVPTATVREVIRWRSAPMVATGTPPASTPESPEDCPAGNDPKSPDDCLVPTGAVLDVRVTEARVASDAGAWGLVGRAEVWRLTPLPETRIADGPLRADLSRWLAVEGSAPAPLPPRRTRWAASIDAGIGPDGPIYGAAVERRMLRRAWIGVAGGTEGVAARLRVEW